MQHISSTEYTKELEADVAGDTSGHFKRLLVSCLQANRDESKEFDRNKAKQDAQAMHEAGEKKWGTDESRFNVILVSRSYAQLRATFQEYAKVANKDIEDTLKSEMSGDLLQGMLAVGKCVYKARYHYAKLQNNNSSKKIHCMFASRMRLHSNINIIICGLFVCELYYYIPGK